MTLSDPVLRNQTLLLIGGGHAHVAVLADWARCGPPPQLRGVLLTPERCLRYSGMVPGWLAGQHTRDAGLVDLKALATRAGVEWIAGACTGLDPAARTALTDTGETIAFDLGNAGTNVKAKCLATLAAIEDNLKGEFMTGVHCLCSPEFFAALTGLIAASGLQAAPGPLYSVFEDVARAQQHIAYRCPAIAGQPTRGTFVDLHPDSFTEVTDQALRIMLERLAEESRMDNYGIYFGNQNKGQVALVERTSR